MPHNPQRFDAPVLGHAEMLRFRGVFGVTQASGGAQPPSRADASAGAPASAVTRGISGPSRTRRTLAIAVPCLVVVIAVIAAGYWLTDGFHLSGERTTVLVPEDSYYSLPGEQYNAVTFVVHSDYVIQGTFSNTLGIAVYILDLPQMTALNHNGTVGSYVWSSGTIANLSVDTLDISGGAGEWNLVFQNPNVLNATIVGFYTAVTLEAK